MLSIKKGIISIYKAYLKKDSKTFDDRVIYSVIQNIMFGLLKKRQKCELVTSYICKDFRIQEKI